MSTLWRAALAGMPPAVFVLVVLACWARPLCLLLGLLVALRRVRGAQRVQIYTQFARAFHVRCRPPGR